MSFLNDDDDKEPSLSKKEKRQLNLLPLGIPRWIRCYDNEGKTADRYTIVFTGKRGEGLYISCNSEPFHPQGIGLHGWSRDQPIDRPTYSHLGKRIGFIDLPDEVKKLVLRDYKDLWEIE